MILTAEEFVRFRLSNDKQEYDKAANENASNQVWLDVIQQYPEMKQWVAHNKTIPEEIMRILAFDEDFAVRSTIARKGSLTIDLFETLFQDTDDSVRLAIAYNAKTPNHVLRLLINDSWEAVSKKAKERMDKSNKQEPEM